MKSNQLLLKLKNEKDIRKKAEILKDLSQQNRLDVLYDYILGKDRLMKFEASKLLCQKHTQESIIHIIKALEENNYAVAGSTEQVRIHEEYKMNLLQTAKDIMNEDFDIPGPDHPELVNEIIEKAKTWSKKNIK